MWRVPPWDKTVAAFDTLLHFVGSAMAHLQEGIDRRDSFEGNRGIHESCGLGIGVERDRVIIYQQEHPMGGVFFGSLKKSLQEKIECGRCW